MIPDWAERFLSEQGEADYDPVSGEAVAWGRRIIEEVPEDLFDMLRERCEVACVYPDWYVIEKRKQFADLMMEHGAVKLVGLGPGGGFKWVTFSDDTTWGHSQFKHGAVKQAELNPRRVVKCDKDGNEKRGKSRVPRRATGIRTPRKR